MAQTAPRNIAQAVVIKDEDIFLISGRDGSIPAQSPDGFGLYYHDCRYLDEYSISFAETPPNSLLFSAVSGSHAEFELTNDELTLSGGRTVRAQQFGCSLQRALHGTKITVEDTFTIHNYDVRDHDFPICFHFDSGFEDIFEIRGLRPKKIGRASKPEWKDGKLVLGYKGADQVERKLEICFQLEPSRKTGKTAGFDLHIPAGGTKKIAVALRIVEQKKSAETDQKLTYRRTSQERVSIKSNWELMDRVFTKSMDDLAMLSGELDGLNYYSAGLPWYGALFGRDSIIAALQTLAFDPHIAASTLRLLAKHQASEEDEKRDAEPGKILHEFRRGELANLNEIPQTPYYGSVDSTPLFLILLGEHAAWTGDLGVFTDLRENIERGLAWIDRNCAKHGGYLSYETKAKQGLGNQGWKDSGDAIVNSDGSLAKPPIALPEVQGYVYKAKLLLAPLYSRGGDSKTSNRLCREAEDLKKRFNRDFWIEEKGHYALALQRGKKQVDAVASNPGQALWSGIVDDSRAKQVMRTLTNPDMFSGWGIRTLSSKEVRYNPLGYHLGTVWPHDTGLIAAGFQRHGFNEQATQVFKGLVEASQDFQHQRLPEVFGGFSRDEYSQPVRYPVACHPQAWAAGAIPYLLTNLLGLESDPANGKLRVNRPVLPDRVHCLELRGIHFGNATVGFRFTRSNGVLQAETIHDG